MHDIGKNIVAVVLAVQQLRRGQPGRDGPVRRRSWRRRVRRRSTSSASRVSSLLRWRRCPTSRRRCSGEGFTVPLLIGGATTSRVHTAVKIEPHYNGPTIWVPDASRSVTVCSSLMSDEKRLDYVAKLKSEYVKVREQHKGKKGAAPALPIAEARARGCKPDWAPLPPAGPQCPRGAGLPRLPACRAIALHRLDAVLPDLGALGALSEDSRG